MAFKGLEARFRRWWRGLSDTKTREFLFHGGPRFWTWLLTVRSVPLFFILSIPGFALIALGFAFHLGHIPFDPSAIPKKPGQVGGTEAVDLGILATVNWSLMFTLVLPYVFACASELNRRCYTVTERLSSREVGIIRSLDKAATRYPEVVQKHIAQGQKLRVWGSLALTVVMILIMAKSWIAPAFVATDPLDLAYENRWFSAALLPEASVPGWDRISLGANLTFDTIAFLAEGFYIFLAFYWVWTFGAFLYTFGKLIASPTTRYNVDLWLEDRENRLGLGSLGRLFTGFLRICVIFLFYGACYSIMTTAWSLHESERSYIYSVFQARNEIVQGLKEMAFTQEIWDLLWSSNQDDISLRFLQASLFIPVIIVSYVPILVMKRYLVERIEQERFATIAKRKSAKEDQAELDKRWEKLSKAEVWPCGNGTAVRYFIFMGLLLIAAFFPAIGIGVCIAIVLTVIAKQIKDWLPTPKWLG